MVGTRMMAKLLQHTQASSHPVKVVLTGDSLQVNPVDAGNALQAIVEFHGTTRIDTIRRQKHESHRKAVARFSKRHGGQALNTFLQQEAIHWGRDRDAMLNMVVRDFVSYCFAFPENSALVLALANDDVIDINNRIRNIYKKLGFVEAREVKAEVTDGRRKWESAFSVGDEVVLRGEPLGAVARQALRKQLIRKGIVHGENQGESIETSFTVFILPNYSYMVQLVRIGRVD